MLGFQKNMTLFLSTSKFWKTFKQRNHVGRVEKEKKGRAGEGNFFPENTYFSLSSQARPNPSSFEARFNKNSVCRGLSKATENKYFVACPVSCCLEPRGPFY